MSDTSDIAKRMKEYEFVSRTYLMKKTPVIGRLDGVAFHTFTRGMKRPFDDEVLLEAMRQTMLDLCKWASGCVFGYTQSDEITLVLTDYKTLNTAPFYEYKVQKLVSIFASRATLYFNKHFSELVDQVYADEDTAKAETYRSKRMQACFDCRVFNLPKGEVQNNLYWRQLDASRNSVSQVAQCNFSSKELYKKTNSQMQDMLMTQKGINWNDMPTWLKRGACCIKKSAVKTRTVKSTGEQVEFTRMEWEIDKEPPIFSKDWAYITDRVYFEGEFAKDEK